MKISQLLALCFIMAFFACSSPVTKKVLVVGRGKITATGNDIKMNDDLATAEETVEVHGDKPVSYNVTTPTGKTTIEIPVDKGFYILNLRSDTLVGSLQVMGKDLGGRTISQEELKTKIDSLNKLTTGANVSPANHNFFILPNQLSKVTSNMDAKVFGPFNKIPSTIEADQNGKAPEIYKFYSNNELRQLIANLKKLTIPS
jgi:hypothetical protein